MNSLLLHAVHMNFVSMPGALHGCSYGMRADRHMCSPCVRQATRVAAPAESPSATDSREVEDKLRAELSAQRALVGQRQAEVRTEHLSRSYALTRFDLSARNSLVSHFQSERIALRQVEVLRQQLTDEADRWVARLEALQDAVQDQERARAALEQELQLRPTSQPACHPPDAYLPPRRPTAAFICRVAC